jgi:hypothetical protein
MVSENTGVPVRLIRVATGYWASYPDEIDAEVAAADAAEENAERAWRREQELLAGRSTRGTGQPTGHTQG